MILHFSAMRPTWLLFDADWVHTRQAAPYLPHLRKIVSIGRVRWIEGSKHAGKDNCAWYLFDQSFAGPAESSGGQHEPSCKGSETVGILDHTELGYSQHITDGRGAADAVLHHVMQ